MLSVVRLAGPALGVADAQPPPLDVRACRRAVDEVYFMCEVENDVRLMRLVLSILEESSQDLRALGHRIHAHQLFEIDTTGNKAIAWEVMPPERGEWGPTIATELGVRVRALVSA